jgi:hypothetical protein
MAEEHDPSTRTRPDLVRAARRELACGSDVHPWLLISLLATRERLTLMVTARFFNCQFF